MVFMRQKRPDAYLLENAVFVLAAHADVPPKTLETDASKNWPLRGRTAINRDAIAWHCYSSFANATTRQLPVHADFTYFYPQ